MNQMSRVRSKIKQLKIRDPKCRLFGAKKYGYQNYPVTMDELENFEHELQITLPKEYKNFLMIVGYGAGPSYGFYPLKYVRSEYLDFAFEPFDEEDIEKEYKHIVVPSFEELTWKHIEQFLTRYRAKNFDYLCEIGFICLSLRGGLIISEDGCSYTHVIVTKGELKGYMFAFDYEGVGYDAIPDGMITTERETIEHEYGILFEKGHTVVNPKPYTFLNWVEKWTDLYLEGAHLAY